MNAAPAPLVRLVPWLMGVLVFGVLVFVGILTTCPSPPAELNLEVQFPSGNPARTEPLIASGVFSNADFLVVTYLDRTTATLSYDFWGAGGPTSDRFTFKPGERYAFRITMPAFTAPVWGPIAKTGPLRVELDGRLIFQADVPFHTRADDQIFFGENPIGGNTSGGIFRGDIYTADDRELRGLPTALFSWSERCRFWFARWPGKAACFAGLGLVAGALVRWLFIAFADRRRRGEGLPSRVRRALSPHKWFLATATVCTLAFAYVVTGGTFRLIFPEDFGAFYDYQAKSLLQGRLDVPESALNAEAFVFGGKYFGYFGPSPALLRLPFVLLDLGFGQWSRSFMLVYYLASLTAVYALLHAVFRLFGRRSSSPAPIDVVLFVMSAGLGSSLFFPGSRAYVYHEAIMCGVAFALWSAWCSLRWIASPGGRAWIPALLLGTLSVHARPPVGLFALSLLGCAAAALLWQNRSTGSRSWLRPIAIGLLSVLGVLSFNGLSYLKFKSLEGAPLKYHVQYGPARLAVIDGKNFHASNFSYNFGAYVWRPNFLFRPVFPYFYVQGRDPAEFPGTKIDLAEPTLALPYTMPGICFLAVIGGALALVRWPAARQPLALLACALLPMSAALFTAIAISQRYTADFIPALFAAAAFGLAAAEFLPRGFHRAFRATAIALALCAMVVTAATTLSYQGEGVWGVPDDVKARYQSLRKASDAFFHFKPTP
ncbi:MAG: hypothetical protein NTV51_26240 [Verrucomicrobia bacterium]|nr:hypothetical protein [Verrucomicrobiota bacterium]